MMKRFLSLLLAVSLLVAFGGRDTSLAEDVPTFTGMNDDSLTDYVEDTLYSTLVSTLNSDDYFVENVQAVYVSQEYIDELAYNSQANVFFGYTLEELNQQFDGAKYIFTLGDNNETTVEPWEGYSDDIYEKVLRNVAIGTGVILVCVTISYATTVAAPAVSLIFACAAKTAEEYALAGAGMGFISAGILHYVQTGNLEDSLKEGLYAGSEAFKWGAISGAITGTAKETSVLKGATRNGLSMNQAAKIQQESGLGLDFIKNFHSEEEYETYKSIGLTVDKIDGENALIREIDLTSKITDKHGKTMTNEERIKANLSPVDASGNPYQLHHIGQQQNSPLAILTDEEHHLPEIHFRKVSEVDHGSIWNSRKSKFWRSYLEKFGGQ